MSTTDAEPRRKLRISSGADLFEALTSPQVGTRVSVLGAIAQYPQRAAAYARDFDPDLVTWLLHEAESLPDGTLRGAVLAALFAFDDPRVLSFLEGEFVRSRHAEYLLSLVGRLQREPVERLHPFFRGLLLQPETPAHAKAAALLLADAPMLTPTERILVALQVPTREAPPALDDSTEKAWLAALEGEHRHRARALLRDQGRAAFEHLAARRDRMSEASRRWLLDLALDDGGDAALTLLAETLDGDDAEAVVAVLARAPRSEALAPSVDRLAAHANRVVAAAAVAGGAGTLEACRARAVDPREDRAVRLACLQRLEAAPDAAHHPALLEALADPHWQVRAAAANALVAQGEEVLPAVAALVDADDAGVRMAAIQVFARLGREAWLEEKLLS